VALRAGVSFTITMLTAPYLYGTRRLRYGMHVCASPIGIALARCLCVINFFMAGPEMVRWELTAVESDGPFRLTVHHATGVIVEYFGTPSAALMREQELEDLLMAARGVRA
jgi:hypothetical protein